VFVRSEVVYRGILAFVVVSSSAFLVVTNVGGTAAATTAPYAEVREQAALPAEERDALAPPRNGTTVVTSHAGEAGDIVAFAPNGTVLYHDDDHDGYWDVDPSSTGDRTVVYSATDEVRNRSQCTPVGGDYCIRQTIERANLSTGETTVLYSRVDPRYHASEWHDIDPLGDSRFVVADMYADEVFVVNASTGLVTWEWSLQSHLSLTTGGQYPADWAHLNDVEVLRDGRVMVSLRNQDQVVFIDPDEGVDPAWTLGSDDRHDVLYEQHNPDYIPTVRGGPAVVIADSENNRLIEYQRTSAGNWTRTWVWKDQQLQSAPRRRPIAERTHPRHRYRRRACSRSRQRRGGRLER
jgi:Arylsulfotransferase (ASST).